MTETLIDPPPAPPPPTRRLARDPEERVVGGVCAAFGRYTDTDPVLWRVAVAVLAVFGGAGLVLYLVGWLLLPRTDQGESPVERLLRRPDRSLSVLGVVVLVVLGCAAVLGLGLDDGPGLGVLLLVGALGYLVLRERPPTAPAYGPPRPPTTYGPPTWSDGGAPVPVAARRPPSRLGGITLSVAALVAGLLLALRLGGADDVTPPRIVATALLVVGAGLLVGTWYGHARWLLAVGLVLSLLLAATAAAQAVDLEAGVGERRWLVTGDSSYSLGAGEGVLDLRGIEPGAGAFVDARVGLGRLTVLVPDDLQVEVVADVRFGELHVLDLVGEGAPSSVDGQDVHEEFTVGGPADGIAAPDLELDLEVDVGEVVMRRVER